MVGTHLIDGTSSIDSEEFFVLALNKKNIKNRSNKNQLLIKKKIDSISKCGFYKFLKESLN